MNVIEYLIRVVAFAALRVRLRNVALTLYRFVAERHPEDQYLLCEYGLACAEAGRLEDAEHTLSGLVQQNYSLPATQILLGSVTQQLGQHEAAIALFEAAIRKEPEHADVHYNLGVSLAALERWEEAISAFTEAVRLEPQAVDASSYLGVALAEAGKPERATIWLKKAVRLRGSPDDHVNLGVNLHETGQLEEAEGALRLALRADPKSRSVKFQLAKTLVDSCRFDEALELLASAGLQGVDAWAESLRSFALVKLGRLDDARSAALMATHLAPDLAEAHASLGFVHLVAGNGVAALAEWDVAVGLDREHPEFHAGRAAALTLNQRHVEAMTIFETISATHPELLANVPELKAAYDESVLAVRKSAKDAS